MSNKNDGFETICEFSQVRNRPQQILSYHIQAEAESIKASGQSAEGIMLRHPQSMYFPGRAIALLKVKNFVKAQLQVVGFTKGSGKYAKSLRNLLVSGNIDGRIINSRAGTGFTDLERSTIFTNQADYLGSLIMA
jgi:ATP-dependent DNA ligase